MDEELTPGEDEWESITNRFQSEGVDWDAFDDKSRLLQVFRWLVDAESNLKATRFISEKQQKFHSQEKQEINEYVNKRVREVEDETKGLRNELETLLGGTQAITDVFLKEGLQDMADQTLGEQIAYLLVERSQLQKELEETKTNPTTNNQLMMLTERERKEDKLQKERTDMREKIYLLEMANRNLEEANENLAWKLSETLLEIDERECNGLGKRNTYLKKYSFSEPSSIVYADERNKVKLSKEIIISDKRCSEYDTVSLDSSKFNFMVENQMINSKSHLCQLQEAKKLQAEVARLHLKYSQLAQQYEETVKSYDAFKLKSLHEAENQRRKFQNERTALKTEIAQLKQDLSIKDDELESANNLNDRMELDLKKLRAESIDAIERINENELRMKKNDEELKMALQKMKFIEEGKTRLEEELCETAAASINH